MFGSLRAYTNQPRKAEAKQGKLYLMTFSTRGVMHGVHHCITCITACITGLLMRHSEGTPGVDHAG